MGRTKQKGEAAVAEFDRFVSGAEPETTKTLRLPERLAHKIKVYAAQHKMKEKDLIKRILEEWFEDKS